MKAKIGIAFLKESSIKALKDDVAKLSAVGPKAPQISQLRFDNGSG